MNLKSVIKTLEKHRDRISKERDSIRDMLDEYEGLAESCDSAYRDIQSAIDSLSEYA